MTLILKAFFSALWGEVFKPLFKITLSTLGGAIIEEAKFAIEYVQEHPEVFNDEDKRRVAREIMQSRLKSRGKEVRDSVCNLFIELVYQAFYRHWGGVLE